MNCWYSKKGWILFDVHCRSMLLCQFLTTMKKPPLVSYSLVICIDFSLNIICGFPFLLDQWRAGKKSILKTKFFLFQKSFEFVFNENFLFQVYESPTMLLLPSDCLRQYACICIMVQIFVGKQTQSKFNFYWATEYFFSRSKTTTVGFCCYH